MKAESLARLKAERPKRGIVNVGGLRPYTN